MNGIQQVGFSRAVVACKNVYALAEIQLGPGIVFKINYRQLLQVHLSKVVVRDQRLEVGD